MKNLIFASIAIAFALSICAASQGIVIELFEDDDSFLENMTNQDAPTAIENYSINPFNGKIALRLRSDAAVSNGQRYNPNIPGWAWRIVNNPSADDEARWIMFAWKKAGEERPNEDGIMIQFSNNGSWGGQKNGGRYFDGTSKAGWLGIELAEEVPREWEYHIRDLVEDFGEFTMTGIALTQFDSIGWYDSIYLAWTKRELQSILSVESAGKLAGTWGAIKSGE